MQINVSPAVKTPSRSIEPSCPECGEDQLIDFDSVQRRFVCELCSAAWSAPSPKPIPPDVRAQLVESLAAALVAGWRRQHESAAMVR